MLMRVAFPLLLAASLALAACQQQESAPQGIKIAVADVARLMRDSVPGKEGIKFLESRQLEVQKELDNIQARLEKNPEDAEAMKDLQRVYASSQQRIQAEGQNVAALLFDTLQRILDNYLEKNGYDVILSQDTLASYSKKIDITNAIMAELDKQKIDFKPLPEAVPSQIQEGTGTGASPETSARPGAVQASGAGEKAASPEREDSGNGGKGATGKDAPGQDARK